MLSNPDLEGLLAASRSAEQADQALAQLPAVAATARHLLQSIEAAGTEAASQPDLQHGLLLCLRVCRNAAAVGGPRACSALLSFGLLDIVQATLRLISSAAISLNWQLPAAVAQTLANLCTACGASAAAAWAALFPLHFAMLAHVNAGATQAAACLALLACCRAVDGAAAALAGPEGAQMMTALLCNHHRMLQQGEHNDNLCLLVAHLAFARDLLPHLHAALGPEGSEASNNGQLVDVSSGGGESSSSLVAGAVPQPTMAQAALLEALGAEAQDMPQAQAPQPSAAPSAATAASTNAAAGTAAVPGGSSGSRGASMALLVGMAERLAAASKAAPLAAGQQQVLQGVLHLVRDICARDDSGAGLAVMGAPGGAAAGSADAAPLPDLVVELQAAGLLPALLAMLKALEPIQNPQRQREAAAAAQPPASAAPAPAANGSASTSGGESGGAGGIRVAELAPALAGRAASFPRAPPYPGFRTDLLAAVANAAHKRPAVQAEVGALGGVELVLAQCQLDRSSPLAREWALWGVRNLCEGNPAAQEAIAQLQLCTTVDNEELQRLGVKLELDETTGKLKVSKRDEAGPDGGGP